jgi:hypothetical protein
MNTSHTLEITIDPNGKITGEVKGVAGPKCGPLSEWLDQLGAVVCDKQTPDYRKPAQQAVTRGTGS